MARDERPVLLAMTEVVGTWPITIEPWSQAAKPVFPVDFGCDLGSKQAVADDRSESCRAGVLVAAQSLRTLRDCRPAFLFAGDTGVSILAMEC